MAKIGYVQTIKGPESIGALLVGVVWDFLISISSPAGVDGAVQSVCSFRKHARPEWLGR